MIAKKANEHQRCTDSMFRFFPARLSFHGDFRPTNKKFVMCCPDRKPNYYGTFGLIIHLSWPIRFGGRMVWWDVLEATSSPYRSRILGTNISSTMSKSGANVVRTTRKYELTTIRDLYIPLTLDRNVIRRFSVWAMVGFCKTVREGSASHDQHSGRCTSYVIGDLPLPFSGTRDSNLIASYRVWSGLWFLCCYLEIIVISFV